MRYLVLLRGSPGCGKSTFISNNHLEQYTISADEIRLLFQTPVFYPDGRFGISQQNEKRVWDLLFQLLEARMERGEFTIVDATHSKPSDFAKYKKLKDKYRYRMFCVDFSDVPIEVTKARNNDRATYKYVPEAVIDNMYARIKAFDIPNYVVKVKPEQFSQIFKYNSPDYSKYKKIHHIGDIHGCFDPIAKYFATGLNDDELYIFIGDYIDRGIQNVEVLEFLMNIANQPNVIMLEGNHEIWLWKWANNERVESREFEIYTRPQLEAANIDKAKVRQFYRKLAQTVCYRYNGKLIFVCHGGLSVLPNNLLFVATDQLIKGVGKYADMLQVTESFTHSTSDNIIHVFGHRNVECHPIKLGHCRNICERVEFGGNLRVYTIDTTGTEAYIEIDNKTIRPPTAKSKNTGLNNISSVAALIAEMEKYPSDISKRHCGGNIFSYNFTRDVFSKALWNDITIKARGLFVNTSTAEIVARAYDKFHNVGQHGTKLYDLKQRLQFPVTAYVKENGYLGITGYNNEQDCLFIASKSTNSGPFAETFNGRLSVKLANSDMREEFEQLLKDRNLSALFEVIEPEYDPHIIEYKTNQLILLDLVNRTPEFRKLPYSEVCEIANHFGFDVKQQAYVFQKWADFETWYNVVIAEDWKYNGEYIEGFVLEDSSGYMTKVKLDYYSFWKQMRTYMASLIKGTNINYSGIYAARMNDVFGYMREKHTAGELANYTSIIALRRDFNRSKLNQNK